MDHNPPEPLEQRPVEIAFHGVDSSDAMDQFIRSRADKLFTIFPRLNRCRVVVEAPHQHQKSGAHYRVHIRLGVPGEDLFVSRDPQQDYSHENLQVTIRDAFQAAERQLKDFMARLRERHR